MTDVTQIQRGRKWAHGRRSSRGEREDLGQVLARLGSEADVARGLLRRAVRAVGERGVRVRPAEARVAGALAGAGVVRLEEQVQGTAAEARWIPWRIVVPDDAASEVREVLGLLDADAARDALLAEVGDVVALESEVDALRRVPAGAALVAPPGSLLAGRSWSTFAAALRAAAVWHATSEPLSARELAARALGWSKAWTPARRDAFSVLVGRRFEDAVTVRERFLRVRGPVTWRFEGRDADARAARPWLGLPTSSVADLEVVSCEADGVLVVENLETFEEVVRRSAVSDDWVCVYGAGYVEDAVVDLLDRLALPTAAWADIDPHGLAIVADLAERLHRQVRPVGMDPQWLDAAVARPATTEQLRHARVLAARLDGSLSAIAGAIVQRQRVVEQEAIQAAVIHDLPTLLS